MNRFTRSPRHITIEPEPSTAEALFIILGLTVGALAGVGVAWAQSSGWL